MDFTKEEDQSVISYVKDELLIIMYSIIKEY